MVTGREAVELTVERLVAGGDGLAELDGRKVFVPFSAPGERVRARLVQARRDYAVARIVEVIHPSRYRRGPRCAVFGRCGGCRLQHIEYDEQLRIKTGIVQDALRRIGRLEAEVVPTLPAPREWHYRNKTQYAVGFANARPDRPASGPRPTVGYYRAGTHQVIPAATCPLHPPVFDAARRALARWIAEGKDRAYNERDHSGNIRHLILRTDGPRTLALVAARSRRLPAGLAARLQAVPGINGIALTHNPERTNRILGTRTAPVAGLPALEYTIGRNRLRVSPDAFFQVNTAQARTLTRLVRARLADRRWTRITDLFSGVGLLALEVADLADRVIGIELDPAAVADANHNARANNRDNVEFRPGDAEALPFACTSDPTKDAVILDPPRKGVKESLLTALAAAGPARVVYVSCDPATLARDLARLTATGYRLASVQPLDMFPQTGHIETVACLDRQ